MTWRIHACDTTVCHTSSYVIPMIASHVTHINASLHTYELVLIWMQLWVTWVIHVWHNPFFARIHACDTTNSYVIDIKWHDTPDPISHVVPLQVNRFAESIVLIVQYRYLKSCSGDFTSPESDPPHKIMRYWFYYSIWLVFSFPPDRICQAQMICIGGVPVSKRHFGGAGP